MADELPIACSLAGPDLAGHLGRVSQLGPELLEARREPGVLALRFAPAARARVQSWLDAEARCCPFLSFDSAPTSDAHTVTVRAPADAEFVLDGLDAALTGVPASSG